MFDARTFAPVDSFHYDGEGWGLTTDGALLYLSDGTSRIRVIDPNGYRVVRTIRVTEAGKPVHMLNELEWVRGELWANVYWTGLIARIDPASGRIVGWIDAAAAAARRARASGSSRAAAWRTASRTIRRARRVLVTGKYWPFVFQLDSIAVPSRRAAPARGSAKRRVELDASLLALLSNGGSSA